MTIAETSIEAYYSVSKLSARRSLAVRAYIEANPGVTNEDISQGLRLRIQSVTPRVKELLENGVIWITGRSKTSTGYTARTYSAASCPHCLSTQVQARRRDALYFDYYCWNCGRRFSARLGERSSEQVEVYP